MTNRGKTAGRPAPTPRQLAARAAEQLRALGDPQRAAGARAYFKQFEPVAFIGVAVPDVRRFARDLHQGVRGAWTVDDAIAFADRCARQRETELKWVGFFVLGRYQRSLPRTLLPTVKRWLADGCCDNWALVDALAPEIITPLLARFPGIMKELSGWTRSRNLWIRRAALVALVPPARKGERLAEVYQAALAVAGDREDLIHKAAGWLLREAGKTDAQRLERFLLQHGAGLPRTTVRYAIERFPRGQRLLLLRATRGADSKRG
jgi:3-methyladenine DNA glycosylase AlkD